MIRLGVRVSTYYLVLFSSIGLLVTTLPIGSTIWPVGGIDQLVAGPDLTVTDVTDALREGSGAELEALTRPPATTYPGGWVERMIALFSAMTGGLLLMLPVSWVYRSIHRDEVHDRSLDETTLVLPAVVAGIVVIVQHSLALAFSLAGIVAGVRFRRALTDTFDTLFILTAIGVGIAAGTRSMEIAIVVSVFFSYATMLVSAFGDGLESRFAAEHKRRRKAAKRAQAEAEAEAEAEAD
ncbi:MAG: DUF4956 domain-containing protein [Pseudomonadota bacterium]